MREHHHAAQLKIKVLLTSWCWEDDSRCSPSGSSADSVSSALTAALKYRSASSLWLFLEHAQAKHNFRFVFLFKIRHSAIHGHWLQRQIESSASYCEGHSDQFQKFPPVSRLLTSPPTSSFANESRERSFGFRWRRHFVGRSFSTVAEFSPEVKKPRVAVWLRGEWRHNTMTKHVHLTFQSSFWHLEESVEGNFSLATVKVSLFFKAQWKEKKHKYINILFAVLNVALNVQEVGLIGIKYSVKTRLVIDFSNRCDHLPLWISFSLYKTKQKMELHLKPFQTKWLDSTEVVVGVRTGH